MPLYKGVLTLEDNGPDTPTVHLFEYSSKGDSKSQYRKQIIALESCIYLGRRNLATIIKTQTQRRASPSQSQAENPNTNTQSEKTFQNTLDTATNEKAAGKEGGEETKDKEEEAKDVKEMKEVKEIYLKEHQEFQGYILKCPNGPYDYAMKLWDTGRAAPPEEGYPKEGEEVVALVVDRTEDFLTVACGSNIAFARKKSFLCNGVDPDDLSLPFARLKVSLRRLQEREVLVPAAGWEATPTQVVVPPYDVY